MSIGPNRQQALEPWTAPRVVHCEDWAGPIGECARVIDGQSQA